MERIPQMNLESRLVEAQKSLPECVTLSLVDIKTGMPLVIGTPGSHPQEVLDLLAGATGGLFESANVTQIEGMFKRIRGIDDDGRHHFQEIIVMSDDLVHVFQRGNRYEGTVLVSVCRASANLGLVLAKSRDALASIEGAA